MKRLKIFTWHIHGSYLYYLSHIPHDIYLPKREDDALGYCGITPSYAWPSNLHEIPFDEVKKQKFDCILFQHHDNYLIHQHEVLSKEQQELPRIYLEHDPPRENPTNTIHPVNDPGTMIVHVTDFNRLMWDCQKSPTTVIDHGVKIPEGVRYNGDLEKGIVIVNNIAKRGRRLGLDIYQEASKEVDLDLVGMGWEEANGIGEVSHQELPHFCSSYRYFFNPIRYTSLGLSICEAMMIGMPIIGLATTELATVVENNVSGFISTRPEELTIAAKELIRNKSLAEDWGEKARRAAVERFGMDRFVRDWNKTLHEVVRS
ncbi:glycosyltransferase [Peredibacter starrii]|uniref:Glycosyltransferase n=1 Tax=Peredibacter starrii TaxID=28202 RepID=A0AAX4HV72_9BACT|nr:glycosyltransferase [Peredibacter starrii]WPU67202.1 glycosyltransferase [Peredibacter starrii]